jgi:hypothetical protein
MRFTQSVELEDCGLQSQGYFFTECFESESKLGHRHVERPNSQPRQYEVGSHRWIDLADKSLCVPAGRARGRSYAYAAEQRQDSDSVGLSCERQSVLDPGGPLFDTLGRSEP